jgi:hypothetical protein
VCFIFSLLNHFYVWDAIVHKVTGNHYPAIFRQSPAAPAPTTVTDTNAPLAGPLTNAPAAAQ